MYLCLLLWLYFNKNKFTNVNIKMIAIIQRGNEYYKSQQTRCLENKSIYLILQMHILCMIVGISSVYAWLFYIFKYLLWHTDIHAHPHVYIYISGSSNSIITLFQKKKNIFCSLVYTKLLLKCIDLTKVK